MKKYIVRYHVDNEKMAKGETPHSDIQESEEVNADFPQEAIDFVIDHLYEQVVQNSDFSPERDGEKLNILDAGGNIVQQFYNFHADMKGEEMRKEIWSVELEANLWADDIFNGTYEECVEWCRKNGYKIDGEEARLARLLAGDDCVLETLEIVDDLTGDEE